MVAGIAQSAILGAVALIVVAICCIKLFFRKGEESGQNNYRGHRPVAPPREDWTQLIPEALNREEYHAQQKLDHQFPRNESDLPTASQNSWANGAIFVIITCAILAWTLRRVLTGQSVVAGELVPFFWAFSSMFAILAFQLFLAFLEKTRYKPIIDDHIVAVIVPLFNEDTAIAWRTLKSILKQERRPEYLAVVNDGSDQSFTRDYKHLRWAASLLAKMLGVRLEWKNTENQGKRHAQAEGLKLLPDCVTIIVTVDSDSTMERNAVKYGLQPFANQKVQSVAGIVLSQNATVNFLTRIMDLIFVSQQLTDRSSMSRLGSVLVNSGAVALYRAEILRDNIDAYLNETFMGVHVDFSDDSLLTLFALQRGKTVQHPRVFSFSVMPENFRHHYKQQIRWFRGSFIRSIWRIRYLKVLSFGFLRQMLGWMQGITTIIVSLSLLVFYPIFEQRFVWEYALVPIIVGYVLGIRYYSVRRSDMTKSQQFGIFIQAPLSWLYQVTSLRFFRVEGAFTCRKTGWQTRQSGAEVTDRESVNA